MHPAVVRAYVKGNPTDIYIATHHSMAFVRLDAAAVLAGPVFADIAPGQPAAGVERGTLDPPAIERLTSGH
jgi:hypothetical protein